MAAREGLGRSPFYGLVRTREQSCRYGEAERYRCLQIDHQLETGWLQDRQICGFVDYVSASIDPPTRRLLVRATIGNKEGLFKPEMSANVTIYAGRDYPSIGMPKQALVYEPGRVRLWAVHDDKPIEIREIETGLTNGDLVEARTNLKAGEKIVTRGGLFIDRAATGS
jgi:cobalt-zinc-cadmium efflux system membrane fusion protein